MPRKKTFLQSFNFLNLSLSLKSRCPHLFKNLLISLACVATLTCGRVHYVQWEINGKSPNGQAITSIFDCKTVRFDCFNPQVKFKLRFLKESWTEGKKKTLVFIFHLPIPEIPLIFESFRSSSLSNALSSQSLKSRVT